MIDVDRPTALPGLVVHAGPDEPIRDLRRNHAWFCDLDSEGADAAAVSLLSVAERHRAARFKRDLDRTRYVARRAFVRRVLAGLVGRPAGSIEFVRRGCGKPVVARRVGVLQDRELLLEFCVSHSQNVLGMVTTADREIGFDLEIVRPALDTLAVAATLLPDSSLRMLESRTGRERDLLFYHLWTRNEALTKLQGRGLDCRHAHDPPRIARWTVRSFSFVAQARRVVGAVALEKPTLCAPPERGGVPTPSALPSPSGGAPCSRTSGSAWPAARSARSTACRSS